MAPHIARGPIESMPRPAKQIALACGGAVSQSDVPCQSAALVPHMPRMAGNRVATKNAGGAMSFAGQVAVVTGASSGIGWAVAKALAAEDCKVGLLARRRGRLEQLAKEIVDSGGVAATAAADVGDRSQILAGIGNLTARLGPVDLLVANAGVGAPTTIEPFNVWDIETQFRVNTLGVVYAVEAVLPDMLR